MKKLLILVLMLFTSCEMVSTDWSSKESPKSSAKSTKSYVRKPNTYWKNCEYKDVVEQMLSSRLEYKLSMLNVDKNFLNEEFYDYYDPKYTKESVLKDIEEEIKDFIRRSATGGKPRMRKVNSQDAQVSQPEVLTDKLKKQLDSVNVPGVTITFDTFSN